ncbi:MULTISPECIES: FAD-dependent monooxygenase [unclassified Streptomyces]|uniref:FAD-dependent monooxygenase n=1 Tax=unclassified Streptomyces TaxID=2593676 RepID=UPI00136EB4BF|nr:MULTISPECIES: FAD-dependent monooxygenase [unclassified Streptomyces]MYY82682.1 NAD(P)-binding protein [Streptomyces sp. SID335]MYZ13363.1 NAD(P)-binding protein [Streptomyces sp. SID337]NDZ89271.1 NAD(P)-binding protein [Streptomyces sp. SID10115]NEB49741.1 NAD(P)-binding protein [Streptomyces sp. SID339]
MSDRTRVAVVGAGVSGLALAILLRRRGVRCDLYEKSTALGAVGAGIQLAPNGARILHELGAEHLMRRRGSTAEAIETRRWDDGALLSRIPHGRACEERFGAPYYLIHRADLQACLVDLLPPGALHLGRAVLGVEQHEDHVELRVADGGTATADVVIGADGVHSALRAAVVDDAPRFSGYSVYRGLVAAEAVPSFAADPRVMFWLGPGRHITYYPVAAGRTVHFSAVCADAAGVAPRTRAVDTGQLVAEFDGWHEEVRQVLGAAGDVTRWGLFDRDLAERYCDRRVALMGDAAHPMLPYLSQGAGQALEDALALADCLVSGADLPSALRQYEKQRLARTAEVHRQSRLRATTFHLADGPPQRRRDAVLGDRRDLGHLEWLYGG